MGYPPPDHQRAVDYIDGKLDTRPLFERAGRIRDEGRGRTITYSPKVFVPITTLCRDVCTYCTFAKPPGAGGEYLTPDDVLAIAEAGDAAGCSEALLTLGDRPEERWPQARAFLDAQGYGTTIGYVRAMSELIVERTGLFPHANPGIMTSTEIEALRPTNVSMGLMLENISPRLMDPGMPHHNCPDKDPAVRMRTIEDAGAARVPFTTGILVGIGETTPEIVDSLFAIRDVHARRGHIQEVIIQNFRAKADTLMRRSAEPIPAWFARVVAVARWILGPEMNLQVPPNLTERYEIYLEAGINDWGGVSPLTIDWVNPEAPWPHLDQLRARTEAYGFELRPRLPVYPEFISETWIDRGLIGRARAATDERGYSRSVPKDVRLEVSL
ncbi:MAG: 7,8-didemethyl-8-hydroxy-5-deazariboflavin synthase CofG [bacterium]|nr:7,8-didemethyl-8-hydroxy-5-deazariboflavin synthase CofG [bacterium]MDE0352102.1 7,8-didemethyl-8-hydroxy-5-deazariboflavin synthase CofG [bacterium]